MLENLDAATRAHMLAELDRDLAPPPRLYVSPRLTPHGVERYPALLREALTSGSAATLARALEAPGILKATDRGRRVPRNAADLLAQAEFNRYYIRGLCARLLDERGGDVEVYRARPSSRPRPESQARIGQRLDPAALLDDLRGAAGRDPVLLPGVNSGLSVRIA